MGCLKYWWRFEPWPLEVAGGAGQGKNLLSAELVAWLYLQPPLCGVWRGHVVEMFWTRKYECVKSVTGTQKRLVCFQEATGGETDEINRFNKILPLMFPSIGFRPPSTHRSEFVHIFLRLPFCYSIKPWSSQKCTTNWWMSTPLTVAAFSSNIVARFWQNKETNLEKYKLKKQNRLK